MRRDLIFSFLFTAALPPSLSLSLSLSFSLYFFPLFILSFSFPLYSVEKQGRILPSVLPASAYLSSSVGDPLAHSLSASNSTSISSAPLPRIQSKTSFTSRSSHIPQGVPIRTHFAPVFSPSPSAPVYPLLDDTSTGTAVDATQSLLSTGTASLSNSSRFASTKTTSQTGAGKSVVSAHTDSCPTSFFAERSWSDDGMEFLPRSFDNTLFISSSISLFQYSSGNCFNVFFFSPLVLLAPATEGGATHADEHGSQSTHHHSMLSDNSSTSFVSALEQTPFSPPEGIKPVAQVGQGELPPSEWTSVGDRRGSLRCVCIYMYVSLYLYVCISVCFVSMIYVCVSTFMYVCLAIR